MERRLREILDEARKEYGPVELKTIGGRYYLYKVSSVYDPRKKRARKVSGEYLGRVTPDGLRKTARRERSIYEYGNARLLWSQLQDVLQSLRASFPDDWREIAALSIVRTIRNVPIKYVKDAWEKLYVSEEVEASLSPNTVSEKMRAIGADWDAQRSFFLSMMDGSSVFFFDLSSIFSRSVNLNLAEKGYNKEHLFVDQVNFALLFSQEKRTPVMLKSMPGSIRDIKSLHHAMDEFPLKGCIMVFDRGFFSARTIEDMLSSGISFIQPLKRGSKLVDYSLEPKESFVYRERGIKFAERVIEGWGEEGEEEEEGRAKERKDAATKTRLLLFEDVLLRGEEHSNLIKLKVSGKRAVTIDEKRLGKIPILTDLDWKGQKVYEFFKEKEEIEQAFDAMKNELENDKSYLGDDDAVRGYFFVSFLSLYLYFRVMETIRAAEMTSKLSVNELLFQLSKVYLVKYGDGKGMLSEVPGKVERLVKQLGLDILPKN